MKKESKLCPTEMLTPAQTQPRSQVLPLLIMFFFTLLWYEVMRDEYFAGMNINVFQNSFSFHIIPSSC